MFYSSFPPHPKTMHFYISVCADDAFVLVFRLISERTVEENILKKANQKRMLGDMAIEGGNFTTAFFKEVHVPAHLPMKSLPKPFQTCCLLFLSKLSESCLTSTMVRGGSRLWRCQCLTLRTRKLATSRTPPFWNRLDQ